MSREEEIRALCMSVFAPGGSMSGEEEIRALCMIVLAAEDPEQFSAAVTDLKVALRNHVLTIHNIAVKLVLENGLKNREAPICLGPITQKQFEIAAHEVKEEEVQEQVALNVAA